MFSALRHWYLDWSARDDRALDRIFEGRPLLSDDEFYQRYFPDGSVSKEVAVGIRHAFVEHVPLDMRRLAPEDNFGRELQFVWSHDSLADVELLLDVEEQFDVSISENEARETLTMGALIRLVDLKVKAKKEPNQPPEPTRPFGPRGSS
jgi:acyl carrier protein